MEFNKKLTLAAIKNLKDGSEKRQDDLSKLIYRYDSACYLSTLPDPSRAAHWEFEARALDKRIREFAAVTEKQIEKVQLPKKENRFSECLS